MRVIIFHIIIPCDVSGLETGDVCLDLFEDRVLSGSLEGKLNTER